jgi:GR25 family glycosyltransferase involved in LPS biosynthesis
MKFSKIPKYVINLERRPDRLKAVWFQFLRHNMNVDVWKATDSKDLTLPLLSCKAHEYNALGIYACMLSHYNLIKHAKEYGFKHVAVFEDDVVLSDDFWDRIESIETFGDKWDMMYLGGHYDDSFKPSLVRDNIYKCRRMNGTYAYMLKNTTYDFILNELTYNYGIDQFYSDRLMRKFNVCALIPFVVDHVDGDYSDVSMAKVKYPSTHEHYKKKL